MKQKLQIKIKFKNYLQILYPSRSLPDNCSYSVLFATALFCLCCLNNKFAFRKKEGISAVGVSVIGFGKTDYNK